MYAEAKLPLQENGQNSYVDAGWGWVFFLHKSSKENYGNSSGNPWSKFVYQIVLAYRGVMSHWNRIVSLWLVWSSFPWKIFGQYDDHKYFVILIAMGEWPDVLTLAELFSFKKDYYFVQNDDHIYLFFCRRIFYGH